MLITRLMSEVTIGGSGANNPVPFSIDNFDFNEDQLAQSYRDMDVIVYHNRLEQSLAVTGKVHVDSLGNPIVSANSTIYLPCPPFCEEGD